MAINELERVEIETIQGLPARGPGRREILVPTVTLVLLILAWEAAVGAFRISPIILPPPSAALLFIGKNLGLLLAHTYATTYEILLGFLLAIVVGLAPERQSPEPAVRLAPATNPANKEEP